MRQTKVTKKALLSFSYTLRKHCNNLGRRVLVKTETWIEFHHIPELRHFCLQMNGLEKLELSVCSLPEPAEEGQLLSTKDFVAH